MGFNTILIGAATLACLACSQHDASQIRTDTGMVSGVRDNETVVYKGIPFAAPPVGSLRWRAPQAPLPWKGVLHANQYKAQCMTNWPPLPTMPAEPVSEDCLYLNVWTPAAASATKRPVMVWVPGGGFRAGSPSTPLYWGDQLARQHGVVVVNLSYRVGPLGFLVHPDLTSESPNHASGNYALLDIIAGLNWVQRNIASFGGDPARVTLFGQSAGAWAINNLMISPLSTGLFQAAIAESEGGNMGPAGTSEGMALLSDAERSGVAFAKSFNAQSIAELRKIPADEITSSTFPGLPDVPNSDIALPIVDHYVIPDDPFTLYATGKQMDVPLLLGYNADESIHNMFSPVPAGTYTHNIRTRFGGMADEFLTMFPSQASLWNESSVGWHMWAWARLHAQTSHSKVFFYHFVGDGTAGHGAELPCVFLNGVPNDERELAEAISEYWTHFAKSGDPNDGALPSWPSFTLQNQAALSIGQHIIATEVPDRAQHLLMDAYMSSVRNSLH